MKRTRAIMMAVAFCVVAVGTAWAGYKGTYAISLNQTSGVASASLADVRANTAAGSYFYCGTLKATGAAPNGYCVAADGGSPNAKVMRCDDTSSTKEFASAIASIQGDSLVYFVMDPAAATTSTTTVGGVTTATMTGACTGIYVFNGSLFSQKVQ
jgi:hypothetical protein